jgi:hypothetical protein
VLRLVDEYRGEKRAKTGRNGKKKAEWPGSW